MPQHSIRHVPRPYHFSKADFRRIEKLLSRCPITMPEIAILPSQGEPFSVQIHDALPFGWLPPLRLGDKRFYADYDPDDGKFLEASVLRATRRIRVDGMWCLEAYTIGGDYADWLIGNPFRIIWVESGYIHFTPQGISMIDECGPDVMDMIPLRQQIAPGDELRWSTRNSAIRCKADKCFTVHVSDQRYECLKLIMITHEIEAHEKATLIEAFVSRAVGTVLIRRYQSLAEVAEWEAIFAKHNHPLPPRSQQPTLSYDGLEFLPNYNTLTDVCLRPLLQPDRKRWQSLLYKSY